MSRRSGPEVPARPVSGTRSRRRPRRCLAPLKTLGNMNLFRRKRKIADIVVLEYPPGAAERRRAAVAHTLLTGCRLPTTISARGETRERCERNR